MKHIDFRSDTVTQPTNQMRLAILNTEYGDWAYGQDEVINSLQKRVAQMFGKQDAAFVITGVFGNQVTMHSVGNPGEEVIVGDKSHLVRYQNGSLGLWSRLMARTVPTDENGFIQPETLRKFIRKLKDSQAPKTTILSLENPTSEGKIYPQQTIKQLCKIAKAQGLHIHLDGARVLHAAQVLKINPKQLIEDFDTMMTCFSKGLGAPLGSIVVGKKQVIDKIRVSRKRLGGILRKPGMVVKSCHIALDNWEQVISKANNSAKILAGELQKLPFLQLVRSVDINMIFFKFLNPKDHSDIHQMNLQELKKYLLSQNIKCFISPNYGDINRLVTHHYIGEDQIQTMVQSLKAFYQQSEKVNNSQ